MSFRINSSHRFTNNDKSAPLPGKDDEFNFTSYHISSKTKGTIDTDNANKKGSASGISIRTTNTSLEDYY